MESKVKHQRLFMVSLFFSMLISTDAFSQSAKDFIISPSEIDSLIRSDSSVYIVDVRTIFEYNAGHLKNAIQSNYLGLNFLSAFDSIPTNKPIILYCQTGHRSKYAAKKLRKLGFEKIYDMDGGIKKWKESDLETVREKKD